MHTSWKDKYTDYIREVFDNFMQDHIKFKRLTVKGLCLEGVYLPSPLGLPRQS